MFRYIIVKLQFSVFTSRINSQGHRIGAVFLCVFLCLCCHMTSHNKFLGKRTRKCPTLEVRERSLVFICDGMTDTILCT